MEADSKVCPFCAETIKSAALICRFCNRELPKEEAPDNTVTMLSVLKIKLQAGEVTQAEYNQLRDQIMLKATGGDSGPKDIPDVLGIPLVMLPIAGMALLYMAWSKVSGSFMLIQARSVLDGAKGNFYLALAVVLIGSALLIGIDASRFGYGKNKAHAKSALRTGPIGWAFGQLLMWIIAYPWYMASRVHASSKAIKLGSISLLLALGFTGGLVFVNSVIDDRIDQVNDRLSNLRSGLTGERPRRNSRRNAPQIVTLSEYHQISDGMSYEQVKRIIGDPGKEMSRSDIAGYTTIMYSWSNSGGSNMNAMFQNDKMVNKAQFGLR